jgi:hypothetical protein
VIGRSVEWTEDQQRALHGLNTRMHAITVMTYDHLLARAEAMLAVFGRTGPVPVIDSGPGLGVERIGAWRTTAGSRWS